MRSNATALVLVLGAGARVTVSIRPEGVVLPQGAAESVIEAEVDTVEFLGSLVRTCLLHPLRVAPVRSTIGACP
jgi:hypothetical protein